MKLMRYNHNSEPTSLARLGVMVEGGLVGDLRAAYARCLVEKGDTQGRAIAALRMPPHIVSYLQIGPPARDAAAEAKDYLENLAPSNPSATGLDGENLFIPLSDARLHATCRPSKVIAVGRNYSEHLKEAGLDLDHKVPSAWIKANSTIVGPYRDIVKPDATQKLDYETELALVIGKK
jgi:2-keto-4-pentenoate hydratase/2-oxohepta-3-ene-1,7-dioic acid hydratase in catechol pathway